MQTIKLIYKHMYNKDFKFLHAPRPYYRTLDQGRSVRKRDITQRIWLLRNCFVDGDENESNNNVHKTRNYYFE